jgi:hypothetical protein
MQKKRNRVNYRRLAQKKWRDAYWIVGDGPYALVASCRPGVKTISLWPCREAAEARNTDLFCGGKCSGPGKANHEIVEVMPAK